MDSNNHPAMHISWLEIVEISLFTLLVTLVLILLVRCFMVRRPVILTTAEMNTSNKGGWQSQPEIQLLMLALPLHLLWEVAQFPLYTVWHEGDWSYILYGLVHCTLGDLLIMLSVFWLLAMSNRTRDWVYRSPVILNVFLFTALGLSYTIYSEILNTRITQTWGYTELMPIVPFIEVGGMPFMQWVLIPPVLIWLMRLLRSRTVA